MVPFRVSLLAVLSALCLSSPLPGQVRALQPYSFREEFLQRVPISSAGIRVGVLTDVIGQRIDPARFFVYLPAHRSRSLCVEISSRDGRYGAEMEYRLDMVVPGRITLSIPSRHVSDLRGYRSHQIAVLARLGNSCERPDGEFVVASWVADHGTERVLVLVNSPAPEVDVLVPVHGNVVRRVRCSPVREGRAIAYNWQCHLALPHRGRRVDLHVVATAMGDEGLPVHLPVHVP